MSISVELTYKYGTSSRNSLWKICFNIATCRRRNIMCAQNQIKMREKTQKVLFNLYFLLLMRPSKQLSYVDVDVYGTQSIVNCLCILPIRMRAFFMTYCIFTQALQRIIERRKKNNKQFEKSMHEREYVCIGYIKPLSCSTIKMKKSSKYVGCLTVFEF